ncbi:GLPGLI family protein [Empedobacter sedimenti]|uniref:GLPGLI family protein n=1 Tax=Empedobacter sedimenti TaxID=3042610 RepID=UPI0024A654B8|nr:GLPGLI family protein [Empedobacter sedimenti]
MKALILFLIPIYSLFAQSYKVEYENRSLLSDQSKKKLSEMIIEDYESPKTYDLFINQEDLCLYKKRENLRNSSIETRGNYIQNYVITNPMEKIIYQDINIENRNYKVKSPLKLNDRWVMQRETKMINGIEATKATMETSKNNTEVWFAKSIKSKCGPSNFVGFPGLVLEILIKPKDENEATGIVRMKSIETLKDDSTIKSYFNNISDKTISMEEFKKEYEEYQKKVQEMYGKKVDRD